MAIRHLLFFFSLIYSVSALGSSKNVLTLTDQTINKAIADNQVLLIQFYAPWCGHCKKLAPQYDKAANELKKRNSKAKVAKIDATVNTQSAQRWKVQGYPTLIFFKNGKKHSPYNGPRTSDGIVDYLTRKAGEYRKKSDF